MTDDVSARLRDVEDRFALIELEAQYCRRFDEHDGDAWAQLFTPDGKYRSRGVEPGGQGVYCTGHEELAAFCSGAPFTGIHLVHVPQFTIHGDTAEGRLHYEHLGAFDDHPGALLRSVGYYDVQYARVDGRWLYVDKVTTVFSRGDELIDGYPA